MRQSNVHDLIVELQEACSEAQEHSLLNIVKLLHLVYHLDALRGAMDTFLSEWAKVAIPEETRRRVEAMFAMAHSNQTGDPRLN